MLGPMFFALKMRRKTQPSRVCWPSVISSELIKTLVHFILADEWVPAVTLSAELPPNSVPNAAARVVSSPW
jgi:hypothetical protein